MQGLRGHHLICLHFFSGEGYNSAFIGNLKALLEKTENGEVEIYIGADNVCVMCPHLKDNKCLYNENAEEDIKRMDERALSLLKLNPNMKIKWQRIRERIPDIFCKWFETECVKCSWRWACEKNGLYRQLREKT